MTAPLYLTPADQGRAVSLQDFEHAQGQEGFLYELIAGKVEVSPIPNVPHDFSLTWLVRRLDRFAEEHPEVINYVSSHARVFVPNQPAATAPEPDLAAYQNFPIDQLAEEINWQGLSPLLVGEVVSPDTPDKDLIRNVELYQQVPSIREYWIVDPRADINRPTLTVYRRWGQRWQRAIVVQPEEIYTTRLLPGLKLLVDPRR